MKRLASLIVFVVVVSAAHPACAVPTYGTEMPEKKTGEVGYQSHIIFRRDMNDSNGRIKSVQHYLDISYSPFDWLALDGKIGMGDMYRNGGNHPKVDLNYGFAGGYGFRVKVLDDAKNRIKTVVAFHHISVHPPAKNIENNKYQAIIDDWEFSLVASKSIGVFTPYAGGVVGFNDLITKTNEIDRKVRPGRSCGGVVTGCSARVTKDISVNVESHFVDETSLSAGVYCKF